MPYLTSTGTVGILHGAEEREDVLNRILKTAKSNTMKTVPNERPGLNRTSTLDNENGGAPHLRC